jgi:hypothetical protein
MNIHIHKLTEHFSRLNIFSWKKRFLFLLAGVGLLLPAEQLNAQSINISGTVVHIPSGTKLVTGGNITLQSNGSINNSGVIKLQGNWNNNANGLINSSPGEVLFEGSSSQTVGGSSVTTFNKLTLDNTAGLALGNDARVAGDLSFTNGKITTGSNTVTIEIGGTVSNASSGKYVFGNLEKNINASGSNNFEIGDATIYAPVNLSLTGVTGSGSVTGSTAAGATPDENNPLSNASGINQSSKANRYWTLTQSGFTFSNYDATFNYDAGEATGNPLNYVVRKFNSPSTWTATATGTVTSTNAQAIGLTSFSEFETGEANAISISCPADINTCNPVVTFNSTSPSQPVPVITCTPSSGSTFTAGTTVVNCSAVNINGTSSCSFNVIIQTPSSAATSATSNATYNEICLGSTVTLNVNGGLLGNGATWVWYEGGCGTGISIGSGSSLTITPATLGSHQYCVRAEGTCNATACQCVTVNVISAPPTHSVQYTAAPTDGCVGSPPVTISVNSIPGCSFYNWSCNQAGARFNGNPGPYQTTSPNVNVTFVSLPASGASGWSICVFGGNACGNTGSLCTWVRSTVTMPGNISGSTLGCPGTNGNAYSVAAVTGAASYVWSGTAGITINGNGNQSVTVDFTPGFVSGTLSVHSQTSCGANSTDRTLSINSVPATPGAIMGSSYPCPNASSVYSIAPVSGAVSYTWTTSVVGAIVTGNTTSCSILFPATIPGGASVSVTANSACPSASAVRSKGIATGLPATPLVINGTSSGRCGQTGASYSIQPVTNAISYTWNTTCGTIVGPNTFSAVTVDWPASFTSCVLSVSATNSCGTGGARSLTVTAVPAVPAVISGNAAPCANSIEMYSTAGSAGATSYLWTVPAGATIIGPSNGASILVLWGSTSGNVAVRGSNSCGNSTVRNLACTISCRAAQVKASSLIDASVFPNPTSGKVSVRFNSQIASTYHLALTDALSREVLAFDGTAKEDITVIDLDLSTYEKGIYILRIQAGSDASEELKVIVQ